MNTVNRKYYRLRFTGPCDYYKAGDYYSSNNGTSEWSELKKIKALLTRGIPSGYKGRNKVTFINYEIVEINEVIHRSESIVSL